MHKNATKYKILLKPLANIRFFLYLCRYFLQDSVFMKPIRCISVLLMLVAVELLLVSWREPSPTATREMKVLCIGNSFSIDAVENNLVELAAERGIELKVGNLYIGGCSLKRHALNVRGDSAVYSYRVMTREGRVVTDSVSILQALESDEWDVVTMQQASHYSGQWYTYEPWLSELIDSVRLHIAPKTKLFWYMTWAYQQDAKHGAFVPNYNGDQAYMYDEILGCNRQVLKRHHFDGFIPGGVAIQEARKTKLGDTLCRDGYHLHYQYGRYLMACLWLEVLTGKSAKGCTFMPEKMTDEQRKITQKVAHKVAKNPVLK